MALFMECGMPRGYRLMKEHKREGCWFYSFGAAGEKDMIIRKQHNFFWESRIEVYEIL